MRIVFSAANSLDAHMVKDMLKVQQINAHVLGEHLQSGVGTLPTFDLVKVVVQDRDYDEARAIIKQWEAGNIEFLFDEPDDQT
jgi:hypothetical protein